MSILHHWFVPHHTNNQRAKLLHPSSWLMLLGFFTIFQIFLGQASHTLPQILGYASQIPPEEVIRLTNVERKNQGLSELQFNGQLAAAAAQKAADMFARDYWAHVSPIGTQPWFFISQSGYEYRYAGENLARDFGDTGSVVRAWMDSPTHRDNLLSNKYQDVGIAVVDGTLGGRETTLVVQMFGTKLSAGTTPVVASSNTGLVKQVKAAEITPIPSSAPTVAPTAIPTSAPVAVMEISPTVFVAAPVEETAPVLFAGTSIVSPFSLTKLASLAILAIIIVTLIADIVVVKQRKITRWTSRSIAHLAFMLFLAVAAVIVYRGQIL